MGSWLNEMCVERTVCREHCGGADKREGVEELDGREGSEGVGAGISLVVDCPLDDAKDRYTFARFVRLQWQSDMKIRM